MSVPRLVRSEVEAHSAVGVEHEQVSTVVAVLPTPVAAPADACLVLRCANRLGVRGATPMNAVAASAANETVTVCRKANLLVSVCL